MEFCANTWWIWLIVAVALNMFSFIGMGICTFKFQAKGMIIFMCTHLLSTVPWLLFIVGAIVALIDYAKS